MFSRKHYLLKRSYFGYQLPRKVIFKITPVVPETACQSLGSGSLTFKICYYVKIIFVKGHNVTWLLIAKKSLYLKLLPLFQKLLV